MSDIVERLRTNPVGGEETDETSLEAADEIERLRDIIRRMDGLIDSGEAALTVARSAARGALGEDE